MDAHTQQTEQPKPTQIMELQSPEWKASEQNSIEQAQAETQRAGVSGERTAVLKPPAFWRRVTQRMLPEATWLAELRRDALPHLGDQTPRQWLQSLNSSNAHVRQNARRSFHELLPAARCVLTAGAYRAAIEYTNNVSNNTSILVIIGVIVSGVVGGMDGLVFGVIAASLFAGVMTSYLRTNRRQELAKDLLDSAQDARLIPFLILRLLPVSNDTWRRRQMFGGRNLRNALVRLLPLVQAEDAAEWTGTHWHCLLRCLRKPYVDIELTQAVVQAMARVGNEEAYRVIQGMGLEPSVEERLTTRKKREAQQANQQLLMQVKQECMPMLEARLSEQRQAQTLLRPSASAFVSASGSDVLLRPAEAYVGETPAEQLLRPQSRE